MDNRSLEKWSNRGKQGFLYIVFGNFQDFDLKSSSPFLHIKRLIFWECPTTIRGSMLRGSTMTYNIILYKSDITTVSAHKKKETSRVDLTSNPLTLASPLRTTREVEFGWA
jgi:hypothetical protein